MMELGDESTRKREGLEPRPLSGRNRELGASVQGSGPQAAGLGYRVDGRTCAHSSVWSTAEADLFSYPSLHPSPFKCGSAALSTKKWSALPAPGVWAGTTTCFGQEKAAGVMGSSRSLGLGRPANTSTHTLGTLPSHHDPGPPSG